MYRIRTFNKISPVGPEPPGSGAVRRLRFGRQTRTPSWSAPPSCWTMIFRKTFWAISRAGAGVNNIPLDRCSEAGIVYSTPPAPTPTP